MSLLKIGIVCYPSVGGSGVVATRLGLELAQLGHDVHFISYERPFQLTAIHQANIHFHKVEMAGYKLFPYPDYSLPLVGKIVEVQKKFRLDVIHVHYAVPHATAALLARSIMQQSGIEIPAIVTTLHGTDITILPTDANLLEVIKYSILNSDGVTAVSESLRRDTLRLIGGSKGVEIIYNFFTPSQVDVDRHTLRQSLGIADSDFVAVHLSNLRPVKRISDLLEVAKRTRKKNPQFKLLILAGDDFAPYTIEAESLGDSLVLQSSVSDIGNYISASDVGIYTSQTESFGMGMLESMAYGLPVVATRAGGIPEVVDDGTTGFLLEVGNVQGMSEKLEIMMANQELVNEMGLAACKVAHERFGSEAIVKQYLEFYQKVIG